MIDRAVAERVCGVGQAAFADDLVHQRLGGFQSGYPEHHRITTTAVCAKARFEISGLADFQSAQCTVRLFCGWLRDGIDERAVGADPLGDPRARDYAARDFKRFLKSERMLGPRR